ncbi:MAG: hypothetical protein U0168_29815 [Nannocystaceae bacterium]
MRQPLALAQRRQQLVDLIPQATVVALARIDATGQGLDCGAQLLLVVAARGLLLAQGLELPPQLLEQLALLARGVRRS